MRGMVCSNERYGAYEADALPTEATQLAGLNQGNTIQG